jgi:hypothetical protein
VGEPTQIMDKEKVDFIYSLLHDENELLLMPKNDLTTVKLIITNWDYCTFFPDRSIPFQLYFAQEKAANLVLHVKDAELKKVYKFNFLNDYPTSIPENIMFKEDTLTKYDNLRCTISYFEDFNKREDHQTLGKLKLRTMFDSYIDFEKKISTWADLNSIKEVQDYIKNLTAEEVLSYNLVNREYFFFTVL